MILSDFVEVKETIEELKKEKRKLKQIKAKYKAFCKIEKLVKKNNLEMFSDDDKSIIIKGFLKEE